MDHSVFKVYVSTSASGSSLSVDAFVRILVLFAVQNLGKTKRLHLAGVMAEYACGFSK
jgi:hypothetical protein